MPFSLERRILEQLGSWLWKRASGILELLAGGRTASGDDTLAHALEFTQRLRTTVTRDVNAEEKRRRGCTVLIVEDEPTNQRVAQLHLERSGCDVILCNNGSEALAALDTRHVDLVFMDVQMPVMDGLEATRRIREREAGRRRIPIVALTANAMRQQVEDCMASGMDDVMPKPIDAERLNAVLDRYVSRAGAHVGPHRVLPVPEGTEMPSEISLERFHELASGDAVLARGLVATFAESARRVFADVESGLDRGDLAQVRRAVHTLKGASANIGATRLQAVAVALEDAAHKVDIAAIHSLLEVARRRFDAARALFEAEIAR